MCLRFYGLDDTQLICLLPPAFFFFFFLAVDAGSDPSSLSDLVPADVFGDWVMKRVFLPLPGVSDHSSATRERGTQPEVPAAAVSSDHPEDRKRGGK